MINDVRVGVVGMGYVGLPLAIEFGKKISTTGFDLNEARIRELKNEIDSTLEVDELDFKAAGKLNFVTTIEGLAECNVLIVTVPTPVDDHKKPVLKPLIKACEMIGNILKKGDVVIFESTVYPGATEEICVPCLEAVSSLKYNSDFFCGYSPERVNPGDKNHRIADIVKVTSGSNPDVAAFVDNLYGQVIIAGTYRAESIKVAEAAKVIENTQRDLNIGLVNELALIFNKLGIDTEDVLKAAETKWNFVSFRPGLVGGHCVGVDPYYLTYKAQEEGYIPEIILAGRRLNDRMGRYVASELIKKMLVKGINIATSKVLIMGLTFKENCPDMRNTKVIDIVMELREHHISIDCYDPWVDDKMVRGKFDLCPVSKLKDNHYDAVIITCAHRQFLEMGEEKIRKLCKNIHVIYDLKYILSKNSSDIRL